MKCEEVEQKLTRYLLGDVDNAESIQVSEHLCECTGCRAALSEIKPTLDLLRGALAAPSSAPERLSAARRARIVQAQPEEKGTLIAWALQPHPWLIRAAALVLVAFVLVGLLMPAMSPARRRALRTGERIRLGLDSGDDLSIAYPGRPRR